MTKLAIIFSFVAVFWALFDQTGSSWVLQAEDLNRNWLGVHWLPSQIQAINPIMIVIMVPIFAFGIYPVLDKVFPLTPLRKVSIGLFVMVIGFAMVSVVQQWVDQGQQPSIGWQIFAYAILTSSEVMVSITCLEFAYTQAPRSMKSVIMALFLMSVSLGNFFTAGVNSFIQVPNQLVAATSLNMIIQAKDKNGKKLLSTQEDILKLTSQTKDINGNSIQYITNQEGSYTLILAGKDGTFGTTTDIRLKFSKGGKQIAVKTAEKTNLNTAYVKIKSYFDSNNNTLPKTQAGTDLIKSIIDNWGSPLQYRLVNRNMFRITSLGADKNYMTENDIVLGGSIGRPSKDKGAMEKP